jgi:hypothetical protein
MRRHAAFDFLAPCIPDLGAGRLMQRLEKQIEQALALCRWQRTALRGKFINEIGHGKAPVRATSLPAMHQAS